MIAQTAVRSLPTSQLEANAHAWPKQGAWRYEDYLRLPDDGRRYEIIEGVLYVANAPGYDHQISVARLTTHLTNFVNARNLGVILNAPFEVHLTQTSRPVQPDVLFLANRQLPRPGTQVFEGAPALIVEVISPSSIRLDRHVKFDAYEQAGVEEYWLVDPRTRSVEVHTLSNGEYALLGQFADADVIRSNVLAGLEIAANLLFIT